MTYESEPAGSRSSRVRSIWQARVEQRLLLGALSALQVALAVVRGAGRLDVRGGIASRDDRRDCVGSRSHGTGPRKSQSRRQARQVANA